jgi:hypothetical protein
MKKTMLKSAFMGILLMAATNANAQINLSNLGKVVSSELSSVISNKNNATKESLVGTWSYSEPAVSFESNNLLKQAGGKIASNAIEKKLSSQFQKAGIMPGKFQVKFAEDGTFTTYKNGTATTSGTYTLDGQKIKLNYLQGTAAVTGYAQIQDGNLSITFDSSKLLGVISKASKYAGSSTLSTISSLAGSYDGMRSGMAFSKYVAPAATTTTAATTSSKSVTAKKTTSSKKRSAKKTVKRTSKKK